MCYITWQGKLRFLLNSSYNREITPHDLDQFSLTTKPLKMEERDRREEQRRRCDGGNSVREI
jgi:hypothetical protein